MVVPCTEANGFRITPEQLEAAITPRTRWVFINSPSNPSGATWMMANTSHTGCHIHERKNREAQPKTSAMIAAASAACAAATWPRATDHEDGDRAWLKGCPETSESTIGTISSSIRPKISAATEPVRAAITPSTVSLAEGRSSRSGAMKNALARKLPTERATITQPTARNSGYPAVVRMPGSGIPNAARESPVNSQPRKAAIAPATAAKPAYSGHDGRTVERGDVDSAMR